MSEIFRIRNVNYDLRTQKGFATLHANTQLHGINFLRCFASKVSKMVPNDILKKN